MAGDRCIKQGFVGHGDAPSSVVFILNEGAESRLGCNTKAAAIDRCPNQWFLPLFFSDICLNVFWGFYLPEPSLLDENISFSCKMFSIREA